VLMLNEPVVSDAVAVTEYEAAGLAGSVHVRVQEPDRVAFVLLGMVSEIVQAKPGEKPPPPALGTIKTVWLPHWPPGPPVEFTE